MNQPPKYLLYPSLLDKFGTYLNPGKLLDFGKTEEEIERELLNAINRVRHESEAADKGTAFNEVVDCIVSNRKSDKMEITRLFKGVMETDYDEKHSTIGVIPLKTDEIVGLRAKYNYRTFDFPILLVMEFAEYFKGAASQVFCEGTIETRYGLVGLYGYADEVKGDTVYDIKTTGNYTFPKYLHSWQRHVYPYCLNQQGIAVNTFEFTITDFRHTYKEVYGYEPEKTSVALRGICEQFIEYIEAKKELITDKKIFNQHEKL